MSEEENDKKNEEKQKEIKRASIQFTDDILKVSKDEVKNKENVDVTTSIPLEEKIKKAESIIVDEKNNNNEKESNNEEKENDNDENESNKEEKESNNNENESKNEEKEEDIYGTRYLHRECRYKC